MAAEWAECRPTTTLLDICCGTGTIGLMMARRVGKVIGLEMVASAIEDAKENAKLNGIENAVYVCGKAEDTLQPALDLHAITTDIVGIVDPPRAGLRMSSINLFAHRRPCYHRLTECYVFCRSQCYKSPAAV
jgi:tRNA (uracil-5-)-methyltransferase